MATPQEIDQRRGLTDAVLHAASASALTQWDVDGAMSESLPTAAFDLIVAIGRCHLFGVGEQLELVEFPLEPEIIEPAIEVGVKRVERTLALLGKLESELAVCDSEWEADDLVIGILRQRVDLAGLASAAGRMIEQLGGVEYQDVITLDPRVGVSLDNLQFKLSELDEAIDDHRDEIARASQTFWIVNLVGDLAANQWPDRPWWMTGEIEAVDQANQNVAAALVDVDDAVESYGVVQYAVEVAVAVEESTLAEDALSLAADDSDAHFEERFSVSASLGEEELSIAFRLPAGHYMRSADEIPDETPVQIGFSAEVPVRECVANDDGIVERVYRVRWGTTGLRITAKKRLGDQSPTISLIGRTGIPYALIRSLDAAEAQRRVYVRRGYG